jgi:FkbM family methyltransferase
MSGFAPALTGRVLSALGEFQSNNWDFLRFPEEKGVARLKRQAKESVLRQINRLGFIKIDEVKLDQIASKLGSVLAQAQEYDEIYRSFGDERSRQVMVDVVAYRILGPRRIKLVTNTPEYWNAVRQVSKLAQNGHANGFHQEGVSARPFDNIGNSIKLEAAPLAVLNTFFLAQYERPVPGAVIAAQTGDVVIDGGGCWGDTALYFAEKVGSRGQVFTFEFAPGNLTVMKRNLSQNSGLANRITIVQNALWKDSGTVVNFDEAGASTSVGKAGSLSVETMAIDDFVRENKLERVDLIKLDIEGAEASTLEGAIETLNRFRPKLAIAGYHKPNDICDLPKLIRQICPSYQIYLDHFTIHLEETMIYAWTGA